MSEGNGNPNAFELLPWHEERRLAAMSKPNRRRKRDRMPPSQPSPQFARLMGGGKRWNGEDYLR